jgi:5'-methylthioadenosine phosphorylase
MAVIPGPRFGTRAEARCHRRSGADLVNMTALPEAALAREAALCYASVAVVTDWDAGESAGEAVTQGEVLERFGAAIESVRALVVRLVSELSATRACACGSALDGLDVPEVLPRRAVDA